MVRAVEASLRRLKTDRIDLYWVHFPDDITPVEEILRGLDDLVSAGKILYAGLYEWGHWTFWALIVVMAALCLTNAGLRMRRSQEIIEKRRSRTTAA
jgi:aryl-alcohol dehydrogenase-like predicted oxidoreductase